VLDSSSTSGAFVPPSIQRARAHSRTQCVQSVSCSAHIADSEHSVVEQLCALVNRQAARIDQLERGLLVTQWRVAGYETFNMRGAHTDACLRVELSPCAQLLASASLDKTILVWDAQTRVPQRRLRGHEDGITGLHIAYTSAVLQPSEEDRSHSPVAAATAASTSSSAAAAAAASSSHETLLLASASTDRTVRLWKLPSGQCIQTLRGHTKSVYCVFIHKNLVLSGGADRTIRLWDIASGECTRVLKDHRGSISDIQVRENRIVSASYDQTIRVWDLENLECIHVLEGHEKFVTCLSRGTGDPNIVFSGGEDSKVLVWNIVTGQCLRKISRHHDWVTDLYVHNDLLLLSACRDGMLRVFNMETGEHIRTLPPSRKDKTSRPQSLMLMNDHTLVVAEEDGRVRGVSMLI